MDSGKRIIKFYKKIGAKEENRFCEKTLFVAAAICGRTIVPLPQTASSAILRDFDTELPTGSLFKIDVFIMRKPCVTSLGNYLIFIFRSSSFSFIFLAESESIL